MTFGDGGRRLDPSSEKVPDPQEGDQQTPEYQNMIRYVKSIKKTSTSSSNCGMGLVVFLGPVVAHGYIYVYIELLTYQYKGADVGSGTIMRI